MLVVTRRAPDKKMAASELQQIVTDGPAVFTILKIQGSRVTIGIVADPSVTIRRGELPPLLPRSQTPPESHE